METRDTLSRETAGPAPEQSAGTPGRVSIDRFEMKQQFSERTEEEKVEAAAVLYEKAVRQWLPAADPEQPEQMDSEELEAISQRLKLQQKCQDIAALMMVEELEDELDEEEPRPKRKQREE
ncbi:MAG: hypothetical protein HFF44_04555 [Lawsonibacter sp.]|nr:hypothetical protein [Lawsonibacter sp.]